MRIGLVVVFFLAASLAAQDRVIDSNANAWVMYFGDHPVGEKWGVHLEGQWRRHNPFSDWQQLLLRPGVNYELSDAVTLTGGYAFIDTHRYGDFPAAARFPEHRMFQQAVVRHDAGDRLDLSHRYRLEQRFIGSAATQTAGSPEGRNWRYENCFRSMLRGTIPLRRGSDWYAALYDEIFVNFGRNVAANVFDQNRAYAAPGRKAGSWGRIEVGYMHQLVQQRSGRVLESNHTVQIAWFSTSPLR